MRPICVLLPDAHGPDVTTYLYDAPASQPRQSLATQWRRAEAVGLAIDQAFTEQGADAVAAERRPVYDKLRAGDTLVVSGVGCFGETYAEISDAIRDLMRRRICLRSINDNLTFDGRVADAGKQASRDSLIAFAAAAAETQKTAKRASETRQALVADVSEPEPVGKDRHGPVLQLGVVAAQLSALAVAAYMASFVSPKLSPHSPASPPSQMAELNRERAEPPLPPPANFRQIPGERPAIVASDSNNHEGSNDAQQSLGISPEREREIFSTVGDWRSARVKDVSFAIAAGTMVPRGVRLAVFPRRLVAREAGLRFYRFIVSGQQIGVVDPTSRRIVAVLKNE